MAALQLGLSRTFERFFHSGKAGGVLLIAATLISLVIANSTFGEGYGHFWRRVVAGLTLERYPWQPTSPSPLQRLHFREAGCRCH